MDDIEEDSESVAIIKCANNELEEPPVKKKKEGIVQKLIGELFQPNFQLPHPMYPHYSNVAAELEMYTAAKRPDLDSDSLLWWNARRLLNPLMCKLVEKYFAFVATSVPSERQYIWECLC